jgi:hypothetical protein
MAAAWAGIFFLGAGLRVLADCSSFGLPFADLGAEGAGFCAAIAEAYYSGLTNGTSATAYSPSQGVTREQMAAFVTRTLDASLTRGSRRAALDQWWTQTPHYDDAGLGLTTVGTNPQNVKSDGADIWVTNFTSGTVTRVRASDGKKLEDWTGATSAEGVLVAMGRVFITGETTPAGHLYMIDPTATAGAVTTLASNLGDMPIGIAFDGVKIWTANSGGVSIVTPGATTPWSVTTKTTGFNRPNGIVFDGNNVWVTDFLANTLLKLDSNGNILTTVNVGPNPDRPAFDGRNIWVPSSGAGSVPSLAVVRASDGAVLKTFSAANGNQNGLTAPLSAAFNGREILVTNGDGGVSLFRATDLSIVGTRTTPGVTVPDGACSDGINFWIAFNGSGKIGRF